jgi:ubiquinone/menaquinone biosynthesis C-methylase UbiE
MSENDKEIWSRYYQTSFTYDARRDTVWKEVCNYLQKKYIPTDSRVLDAGAGYCNFINNIQGAERHAIDILDDLPQYADPGVVPHIHSASDLSIFDDGRFDVVFASNLLEHLTRIETTEAIRGFRRILAEGGKLVLLQPNFRYCFREYFDDYTHLQIFTDRSLAELLAGHDFRIIDNQARFLPVNMKTTLRYTPRRLDLLVRAYLHSPVKPRAGQMLIVAAKEGEGRS